MKRITEENLRKELLGTFYLFTRDDDFEYLRRKIEEELKVTPRTIFLVGWIREDTGNIYELLVNGDIFVKVEIEFDTNRFVEFRYSSLRDYMFKNRKIISRVNRRAIEMAVKLSEEVS